MYLSRFFKLLLAFCFALAVPSDLSYSSDRLEAIEASPKRLRTKDGPLRAANFLSSLLRRLWISRTLHQPTDMIRGYESNFCGDDARFPEASRRFIEEQSRLNRDAIWSFKCSPVRLLHVPSVKEIKAGRGILQYGIAYGVHFKRFWQDLSLIIRRGSLGNYELLPEKAARLTEDLTRNSPHERNSLAGFPFLDRSPVDSAVTAVMFRRLSSLAIENRTVEVDPSRRYLRVSIPVGSAFFP